MKLKGNNLGGGLLSDAASPTPIAQYLQVLADFWAFAASRWQSLTVTDQGACDRALTAYANAMASNLDSVGEGGICQSGAGGYASRLFFPWIPATPQLQPCTGRVGQTLPDSRRTKIADSICDALIGELAEYNHKETALWVATAAAAYLRPSENHNRTIVSLVPSGSSCAFSSLISCPLEAAVRAKNSKDDAEILMGDVRMPWPGQALWLQADRIRRKSATSIATPPLLLETPAKLIWGHVKASALSLGVSDIVTTLYAFRHVGLSRDQVLKLRSLLEIQRRGRWSFMSSVKHYEGHGRAQQIANQYAAAAIKGAIARKHFAPIFCATNRNGR